MSNTPHAPTVRHLIYLAGLLHDVGKVGQRAEHPASKKLSEKYAEAGLAPTDSRRNPRYTHVWWTAWWIEEFQEFFGKEGLDVLKPSGAESSLTQVAARHHRPWEELAFLERIIGLADSISSGADRTDPGRGESKKLRNLKLWEENPSQAYKKLPLLSIWAAIRTPTGGNPRADEYWGYPISELTLDSRCFPRRWEKATSLVEDYKRIWQGLTEAFDDYQRARQVDPGDFRGVADTLLALLHRYTWAVPSSSYDGEPIVGLYDHLKTTAAFALALYDWVSEEPETRKELITEKLTKNAALEAIAHQQPFLLVGGDLSGIQSFIYDIYSSKAKKALKGRSFFLQLLTEVIIEKILRHPDVEAYRGNVLYASGGKFYLILPNTEKVKKALEEVHEEVLKYLWENFQDTLYVAIASVPFGLYTELKDSGDDKKWTPHLYIGEEKEEATSIGQLWGYLINLFQAQKIRRWKPLMEAAAFWEDNGLPSSSSSPLTYSTLFECAEEGGTITATDVQTCALTGHLLRPDRDKIEWIKDGEEEIPFSAPVAQQIRLGERLAKARWIYLRVLSDSERRNTVHKRRSSDRKQEIIMNWEVNIYSEKRPALSDHQTPGVLWRINGISDFLDVTAPPAVSLGFYLYGGNRGPMVKGKGWERPASFEDMVGKTSTSEPPFSVSLPVEELRDIDTEYDWVIPPEARGTEDSRSYLGILRADVDNLGLLFSEGLKDTLQSFSIYSTLSGQLNWFFAGYLNTVQAAHPDFRHHLQIIYASGDDLFAVGRWDVALTFARTVRQHFHAFTCRRPDLTISSGLPFVRVKYPIQRAAELSGEQEDAAKSFVHFSKIPPNGQSALPKDAIAVMGVPISWNPVPGIKGAVPQRTDELSWTLEWARRFAENLGPGKLFSHGFLHLLNQYYHTARLENAIEQAKDGGKPTSYHYRSMWYIRWFWHLVYQLGRRKSANGEDKLLKTLRTAYFCGDSVHGISIPPSRAFVLLSIAAQLALLWERHLKPSKS